MKKEGKSIYLNTNIWGKVDSILIQTFDLNSQKIKQPFMRELFTAMIDLADEMVKTHSNKYELIVEINNLKESYKTKTESNINESQTTTIKDGTTDDETCCIGRSIAKVKTAQKALQEIGRSGGDGESYWENKESTSRDNRHQKGDKEHAELQETIHDRRSSTSDSINRASNVSGAGRLLQSESEEHESKGKNQEKRINDLNNTSKVSE
ncbi:hypothetical protein [Flammeovirga pacifica]|uniref:Uncharacterized protein n=1 Tax=Flammeovirga pacifica TaxID=915059 RepID=A0A1S1Z2Q8_FLAPC|nr:hypothetical protein [Flammeovirga pacifica]OHX67385.1 hypothetical protein NH26_14040 [Flammeovirga pacifica]